MNHPNPPFINMMELFYHKVIQMELFYHKVIQMELFFLFLNNELSPTEKRLWYSK